MNESGAEDRGLPMATGGPQLPAQTDRPRSTLVSLMSMYTVLQGSLLAAAATAVRAPSGIRVWMELSGIITLAAGVGLWRRKEWARQAFMGVTVYNAITTFISTLVRGWSIVGALLYAGVAGVILYYLASPRVREEFQTTE